MISLALRSSSPPTTRAGSPASASALPAAIGRLWGFQTRKQYTQSNVGSGICARAMKLKTFKLLLLAGLLRLFRLLGFLRHGILFQVEQPTRSGGQSTPSPYTFPLIRMRESWAMRRNSPLNDKQATAPHAQALAGNRTPLRKREMNPRKNKLWDS